MCAYIIHVVWTIWSIFHVDYTHTHTFWTRAHIPSITKAMYLDERSRTPKSSDESIMDDEAMAFKESLKVAAAKAVKRVLKSNMWWVSENIDRWEFVLFSQWCVYMGNKLSNNWGLQYARSSVLYTLLFCALEGRVIDDHYRLFVQNVYQNVYSWPFWWQNIYNYKTVWPEALPKWLSQEVCDFD